MKIAHDKRKAAIFMVTFKRDLPWMKYALGSIKKYCRGFAHVTIAVPTEDIALFLPLERTYGTPETPVWIKDYKEMPGAGFVHHLAMKCYADVFCPGASHILFTDPDCIFIKPTTPEDYFVEDKPVLLMEKYSEIEKTGHPRKMWKAVTEMALKFPVEYETMCRHPAVHPTWLLKRLRDYMEEVHPTPFTDFVVKQRNAFPQGYGEFNTMGAFAKQFYGSEYHWIDRENKGEANDPEKHLLQLWSYTGAESTENQKVIKKYL